MTNKGEERDRQTVKSQTNKHTKDGKKVGNRVQIQYFNKRRAKITDKNFEGKRCAKI